MTSESAPPVGAGQEQATAGPNGLYTSNPRRLADHKLLNDSLALIAYAADDLMADFYRQLFVDYPQVRTLFPADMQSQREKLLKAIVGLVSHYDRIDQLVPALAAMGRRHVGYGAELGHYAAVGSTLMTVLQRFLDDAWTAEVEGAWNRAYAFAAGIMLTAGSGEDPAQAT